MPKSDFPYAKNPYLVPFNGKFRVKDAATDPPKGHRNAARNEKELSARIDEMSDMQKKLYASDKHSLLLVFQAMDAAGKDGTVRAVMTGINPAGCEVHSFKKPSDHELDHDFLWRVGSKLPERGRIGIFNRSHYEEVLVVRVHPEFLDSQQLPRRGKDKDLFEERYESIRDFEKHLARNGTTIVKFWLNVSKNEQKKRLLERIDDPRSHWKFNPEDVKERGHWNDYMEAYERALNETSRPWAPWYAIPADDKAYMRARVAEIITETLAGMNLEYPTVNLEAHQALALARKQLTSSK